MGPGRGSYRVPGVNPMVYVLIRGPSYRNLDFEAREAVREGLRTQLETHGIRFLQYDWVWDEADHCLLLVGTYACRDDARWWMRALQSMGFDLCIRTHLPGEPEDGDRDEKPWIG